MAAPPPIRGGSGSNALTFSYTVAAGQNTADLAATAVNLNSATVTDGAGNAANLSLTGLTQSGPQIDTTTPTHHRRWTESPASGDLNAGKTVTLTLNLNEAVTVAAAPRRSPSTMAAPPPIRAAPAPTRSPSATPSAAGQNTASLAATAVNLNSATVSDGAGNAANLSLSGLTQSGPQIDTTTPTISSLAESPTSGDLNAGKTVTLTLNLNEAVTVAGGTPTLTLNDGGTATYTGGSGSNALTFSYTVGRRAEYRRPCRHRRQSQLRDRQRRRRQCRQSVTLRSDPERAADRYDTTPRAAYYFG